MTSTLNVFAACTILAYPGPSTHPHVLINTPADRASHREKDKHDLKLMNK
jgi:hypothetical protein